MRYAPAIVVLSAILVAAPVRAQPVPSLEPTSTHIFPAGGKRGTAIKVRVGGECLPPGMSFKVFGTGISGPSILGPEVKARYEPSLRRLPRDADAAGSAMSYPREFDATLTIDERAEPGARFWRVSGAWGGTRLRPFLIGDLPEFIETEPNSLPELAERVRLPVVVNGQIAGERDQDYFIFSVNEGAVVVCDVMAARIGSPLEPVVAITDPQGRRLEAQETRVSTDPVLSFRAPKTGDYRLHIANLSFYGGPAYVYRITLTTGPYAAFAFPPGGRIGTTGEVEVFTPTGTGSFQSVKEKIYMPRETGPFRRRDGLFLVAGDLPEVVESSDNRVFASAMELMLPVTVNGRFLRASEEDWFRFAAEKGKMFTIACRPGSSASAAVPTLSIHDQNGTELARASSAETPDQGLQFDWQAPADGIYRLRLRDLRHGAGGGPEYIYRLSVRLAVPSFSLRLETDYINVVQGGKKELELIVERTGGFTGPIDLTMYGLPGSVKIEPPRIEGSQTRVKINLVASAEARPTDGLVRLVGKAAGASTVIERRAAVPSFGWQGDMLHVTIQHKPVFRLSCSEAYQYAPCGTIHPYKMKIERFDGFDGPIVLQICDRQVQDLDGVEILETVIPPGAKEVTNRIYFPETMHASVQAHSRPYVQAYATFTDKWGQKQVLLAVSNHRCMVRTLPPVVKLRALTKELSFRPGDILECRLALERASFGGPAEVALMDIPGCSADIVRIEADQDEAVVRVHVGKDVRAVNNLTLRFRATGRLPSGATAVTEATVPVRVK